MAKYVERSATLALCPTAPFLATGTVAGAFDHNFSSSSSLEIFSLDFASPSPELPLAGGAVHPSERFNRLTWGTFGIDGAYPYGLLAGGLVDGTICLWDPAKLINAPAGTEDVAGATVATMNKHHGGVKGLQFNLQSPNLLASGGGDGELCIWDVSNPAEPSLCPAMKGSGQMAGQALPEIRHLAWNHRVQHILASCTAAGSVVVWDLKKQRPVISFKDSTGKRSCSCLQWNPEVATQLVVASDDDSTPSLQLWDLRNSMAPVKELHGHTKGVLSLSWCKHDPALLLSSGKDNRTVCWDVRSGELLMDSPGSQWSFEVEWSLRTPGLFASASFDGKVAVGSITSSSGSVEQFNYDGSVSVVPAPAPLQGHAPAWLRRPAAASFGFGGKLAVVANDKRQLPTGEVIETGSISITQVVTDSELVHRSEEFERAIRPSPQAEVDRSLLRGLCTSKAEGADGGDERETWRFMGILFEEDARRQLLHHLGFEDALPPLEQPQEQAPQPADADAAAAALGAAHLNAEANHHADPATPSPLPDGDGTDFFSQEHEADHEGFFNNLPTPPETPKGIASQSPRGSAVVGADGTSTPASPAPEATPGKAEALIERALFVGNYAAAVDECLKVDRMADALLIASIAGDELWRKAHSTYMRKQPRPYMRVVQAVLNSNLKGVIDSRPLDQWRETLAILVTYANSSEWQGLCDTLGARLAAAGMQHAATLCYICAGNVDEAVSHWTGAVAAGAGAGGPGAGAGANGGQQQQPRVEALQSLMEKAVILGVASGQRRASPALSELVDQYVGLLASQGCMAMAWEYLEMVPGEASAGTAILKDRLYRSGAPDIPPTAKAPHFPFEAQEVARGGGAAGASGGYGAAPAAAAPAAAANGGYGYQQDAAAQQQQQAYYQQPQAPQQQQQQAYYQQQQQPQQQQAYVPPAAGYNPGGYAAAHQQPYGAAPPPQAAQPPAPAAFTPTAAPVAYTPAAPAAFVPAAPAAVAPPPPGAAKVAHEPPRAVPAPSAFTPTAAPAPPTVFAPAAAPVPPSAPPAGPPSRGPPPPQARGSLGTANSAGFAPQGSAAFSPQGSTGFAPVAAPAPAAAQPMQPAVFSPAVPPGAAPSPAAAPAAAPEPPAPAAPAGPPPTVNLSNVDTSSVAPELQGVVASLGGLYSTVAPAAPPTKKREMEDNSKRLGQLFWRLNAGDVSPSVAAKLQQLCQALDTGDYAAASHIQINLTTTDWQECSTWLTALKRLMKARQAMG